MVQPDITAGRAPKLLFHTPSAMATKTNDARYATVVSWVPAASPMPMAINMYTASIGSSSEVRKRTAATMPAKLNARARLPLTKKTTSVMEVGITSRVWAKD